MACSHARAPPGVGVGGCPPTVTAVLIRIDLVSLEDYMKDHTSRALAKVLRDATTAPEDLLTFVLSHTDPPRPLLFAALSRPELSDTDAERLLTLAHPRYAPEATATVVFTRIYGRTKDSAAAVRAAADIVPSPEKVEWFAVCTNVMTLVGASDPVLTGFATSNIPAVLEGFIEAAPGKVSQELAAAALLNLDAARNPEPLQRDTASQRIAGRCGAALRHLAQEPDLLTEVLSKLRNPHTVLELARRPPENIRDLPPEVWSLVVRRGLVPLLTAARERNCPTLPNCIRDGFGALEVVLSSLPTEDVRAAHTELTKFIATQAEKPRQATLEFRTYLERRLAAADACGGFPPDMTVHDLLGIASPRTHVADWVINTLSDQPDRWSVLATVMDTLGPDTPLTETVITASGVS